MGYVQDIHHFAVCDLCGKKQEIEKKELTSDIYGRIVPPHGWARTLVFSEAVYMCPECQRRVDVVYGVGKKAESLLHKNGWKKEEE